MEVADAHREDHNVSQMLQQLRLEATLLVAVPELPISIATPAVQHARLSEGDGVLAAGVDALDAVLIQRLQPLRLKPMTCA